MTTRPLKLIWLKTVSRGALQCSLAAEQDAPALASHLVPQHAPSPELSLLARIKLWFQMLWGMAPMAEASQPVLVDAPRNRYNKRRRKSGSGRRLGRNPITCLLLRRKGVKICQQWLYNHSLAGRVRWCFHHLNPIFVGRRAIAYCESNFTVAALCNAPLCPD